MEMVSYKEYYEIIRLNDSDFCALVVQTSCYPPSKLLDAISNDLLIESFNGKVVIDCLLYAGNAEERFISAYFDGKSFDLNSIRYINIEKGSSIRKLTSEFLRGNRELVEYSILNSYQKKLVLFGCSI